MDLLKVPVQLMVLVEGRPLTLHITHITKHPIYVCGERCVSYFHKMY